MKNIAKTCDTCRHNGCHIKWCDDGCLCASKSKPIRCNALDNNYCDNYERILEGDNE